MGPAGHLVTIKRSGVDGARFPLSLSTCWFGRGIECDIRIQLPVVSKQHCKIEINQQKATLINFSSSNPTLLNGVAIEHPVLLQHGDVITIVDRSFRYEDASHQDGSSSTTLEGHSCPEESLRRLSASRSSLGLDGTVPEPKDLPEEGPEEKVLEHGKNSRGAARRSLERGTGRRTTDGIQALEQGRAPAAGTWPRTPRPEKGRTSLSPSQQLYKSMKEDLDARAEKENVPQGPQQKSGTQKLQGIPPTPVSGGSRWKSSMGGVHLQATPLPREQTLTPKEQQSPRGHPISSSCSRPGTPNAKHSGQPAASPQTASRKRRRHSEDLDNDGGRGSPGRGQTPTKTQHACPRDTPEKPLSKKRRRLSATDILALNTATQSPSVLAPLFMQGFGDTPQAPCTLPEKAAVAAGQGSPGLGSVGMSSCNPLAKWTVEEPGKRRRVSFGGRLRPELFDENLPPNTPLKRGETPKRRQSATPAVLKKIIKGQPQAFPGPEAASSDVLATPPTANSGQSSPSAPRSSRRSTTGTLRQSAGNTPGRTSRRRSSTGRGQQNLLQLIYSKRRSGASGANLMVAKSWADVVKLGAKPTQARVARRAAPTQPQRKRKRIQNTPKKPVEAPHPFSTGHANSPCTITVGRAQLQKLSVPARPHRIFDHLMLGHKAGLPEDLSGLAEMFQTPGKSGPRRKSVGPTRPSESRVLLAGKLSSPCSKEVPLPVAEDTAVDATSQACGTESAGPKPLLRRGTAELTDSTRKTPPSRRSRQLQKELRSMAEDQELTTATALLVRDPGTQTSLTPGYGDAEQAPILHLEPEGIARRRSRRTETREPRDDTTTLVSPQEISGLKPLCMGPTNGTESTEHQACGAHCPSLNTEPRDTPTYINGQSKTPSQAIREPPASRRSSHTPAKTTLTCKGPISDVEKVKFLQETPKQDVDTKDSHRGSRRRSRTPKRNTLDELTGFKELFQTPEQAKGQETESQTTLPCLSPKSEIGDTPPNTNRKSKAPSRSVGESPTPRRTSHTPARATPTCKGTNSDVGKVEFLQETPKQDMDSEDSAQGNRRYPKTPRRNTLGDLTGFKELFQTPEQPKGSETQSQATAPCPSSKSEKEDTPTNIKRKSKTPSQDVRESPAIKKTHIPHRSTPTCKGPTSGTGKANSLQETPKQVPGPAEGGSVRGLRTPRVKMQTPEDMIGFQELFWTPEPEKAPKSETRPGTPKVRAESLGDLTGFKELFQTPEKAKGQKVKSQVTSPCLLPKAEPRDALMDSSRKSKTPSRGMVEPPAARTPLTLGKAVPQHTGPAGDEAKAKLLQETQKQTLGPTDNVRGNRRQPRTPKVKAQPLEDLTGFKELFQTPEQAKGWRIESQATAPCLSSKADPGDALTDTNRKSKTPSQGTGKLPRARRTPLALGRATLKHTGSASDMGTVRFLQKTLKQARGLADDAKGSRRQPGTPKVMAEDLEDLTGLRELFQSPEPTAGPIYAMETCLEPHEAPQADSILAPRRVRQPREPAAPGEGLPSHPSTQGSRRAIRTGGQQVGGGKGSEPLQRGSEECPEIPESLSRSRRQLRAARTGLKALSSSAEQGEGPTPQEDTLSAVPKNSRMVRASSLPKPAQVATGRTRRLQTPAEPSACPRPTRAAMSRAMRGDQADLADSILNIQRPAGQKLEPAESKTGARRQLRAARVKTRDPVTSENPAGLQELSPLLDTEEPDSTAEPRVIHRSSPAPTVPTTSRTRRCQAPTGPGPQEKLSSHRQPTQAVVTRAMRGDQTDPADSTGGPPGQKLEPVETTSGARRQLRVARAKTQDSGASGNPARMQEPSPLQDTGEPDSAAQPRVIHGSSPTPTLPTTGRTRRRQAPAGPDSQEQPSDRRRPTRAIVNRAMRGDQANPADSTVAPRGPTGQKLEPALSETGGRRQLRATRAKVRVLGDPVGLKEPLNTATGIEIFRPEDRPSEEPPTATQPEPEPAIPSSKRRRLQAPVGTEGRDEEPPAPARATRATRGAVKVPSNLGNGEDGPAEQMSDMAGVTEGKRKRQDQAKVPSAETEASLRVHFELPQLAQMSPSMKRPTRTSRRGIQGPPKGSAHLGLSVSPGPPVLSPLQEGRVTKGKRQRPNTPARAVEDHKPAEKRRRTALEPVTAVKSQSVRGKKGKPADQSPSVQEQAKRTPVGDKVDEQGPLHPRHPIEVAAMPEPESLKPAEKTRAKRDRRPLVDTSQDPEPRGAAHKDARIPESKAAPRSARNKSTLPPRASKESQDEGGPRKIALRPKKKLDNVDQDPRPRATRSTKRGDDNEKENGSLQNKKLCLRSVRKQVAV